MWLCISVRVFCSACYTHCVCIYPHALEAAGRCVTREANAVPDVRCNVVNCRCNLGQLHQQERGKLRETYRYVRSHALSHEAAGHGAVCRVEKETHGRLAVSKVLLLIYLLPRSRLVYRST